MVGVGGTPSGNIQLNWSLYGQPRFGENVILVAPPTNQLTAFQWRQNGTVLSGQTNFTVTLTNFQPANAGTYSVVTSNALGRVINTVAYLTPVELRLTNLPPDFLRTNLQFTISGPPNSNCLVEAATQLGTNVTWRQVVVTNLGASGSAFIRDSNAINYSLRYYRVAPQ